MPIATARAEPSLKVTVTARRTLCFASARPNAHVRAASGVCWHGSQLYIVEDDALRVARVTPVPFALDSLDLPLRADGARFFDAGRGNKRHKPDLEACLSYVRGAERRLFGIGSGSSPRRETFLCGTEGATGLTFRWAELPGLYQSLRSHPGFLTSELNLEGAVDTGTHLRLFQRSNGTPNPGATPLCASIDVAWDTLIPYLDGASTALPALSAAAHYALPTIGGVRLTVTCAQLSAAGELVLLASAEASPNAFDDGAVLGSALLRLRGDTLVWGLLCDEAGAVLPEKAEGICPKPGDPNAFYVVFDADDPERPAVLAELHVVE
jgi:hypothetical protein